MYVARLTRATAVVIVIACALLVAGALTLPRASADEVVVKAPKVEVSNLDVPAAADAADEATLPEPPSAAPAVDADESDIVAELPATKTDGFGMVGVTWSAASSDKGVSVEVRTRTAGVWSPWEELEVDNDSDQGGRNGTEPLWVGQANGVAARVYTESGVKPRDLEITTIDPGVDRVSATAVTPAVYATSEIPTPPAPPTSPEPPVITPTPDEPIVVTPISDGAPSFTAKPKIISRAAWGASAGTKCDTPLTGNTPKGVILHHTAGSNTYTAAQSAAIVRATQSYHVKGRKWCDIGYNVLVDRFGQVFEGRKGGIDKPVRGAHAGNSDVNTYAWGVSMMGNFDTAPLTPALKDAVVKVIGWRLGTTYKPAKGTYAIAGKSLNIIAGHRDVSLAGIRPATATACPGKYGYAWLNEPGGLRDRVASYIAQYNTAVKRYAVKLGSTKTGAIYVGEYATGGGYKARFSKVDVYSKSGAGTHHLDGVIRTVFNRFNSQTGVLGFPKTNRTAAATSGVAYARFQNGSIYRIMQKSGKNKGYAIYGAVDTKYRKLKGTSGKLGKPTTSVYVYSKNKNVLKARFQRGYIKYDTVKRTYKVAYT